jgi:hypothetical protein
MNKRVPEPVRPMLQAYLDQLSQQLPEFISAVCLHGSIALDAFDEQRSDIDTLAVIARPANEQDIQKLTSLHQTLANQYPRWLLEVSYVQATDLGKPESSIKPHPIHHDNVLQSAGNFDTNPVTWWLLKNKGIALVGTEPQQLPFMVDWDTVLNYVRGNINTYWASFTHNPLRILSSLSDEGVVWIVLGVVRQYYSFKEQDITSKIGAGEYALQHLPNKWHNLIQDALDIRRGHKPTRYASRFTRAYATIRFVRHIIEVCNALP